MKNKRILGVILIALLVGAVIYLNRPKNPSSNSADSETETSSSTEGSGNGLTSIEKAPIGTENDLEEENNEVAAELNKALNELPTLADLQSLSEEEVHHTPEVVMEGGKLVGEILEQAEKNPARREETVKFLAKCSEAQDVVPAVRAVCWKKTLTQINEWKVFIPVTELNVSDEIKSLGARLP